jgi:hypothetical protein
MMPSTIAGNTSPDPAAGDLAGPIQHTELENENSGQVATPPPEPDDFTSDAPLIEAYGNIKSIWPDDCENELPKLGEKQTRDIVSTLLEDTISMYHFATCFTLYKANREQIFQPEARANTSAQ